MAYKMTMPRYEAIMENQTFVGNGLRKRKWLGAYSFGFLYKIVIPPSMKGTEKSITLPLPSLIVRSAIAMSAVPSISSPTIPVHRPVFSSYLP